MNIELFEILQGVRRRNWTVKEAHDQILSLMGENPGGVSNDSSDKSGVSHGVRERDASRSDSSKSPESFVGGSLENRTDSENNCHTCKFRARLSGCEPCFSCDGSSNYQAIV